MVVVQYVKMKNYSW